MLLFASIGTLLVAGTFLYAYLYRLRGTKDLQPVLNNPWEDLLFCTFSLMPIALGSPLWLVASGFAACFGGTVSGYGQYFMSMLTKAVKPEFGDRVISWFFGADPRTSDDFADWRGYAPQQLPLEVSYNLTRAMDTYGRRKLYWRCVAGMSFKGFLCTLGPAIAAAPFFWPVSVGFVLAGLSKGLIFAYWHERGKGTEYGEWTWGGVNFLFPVLPLLAAIL